MSILNEAFKELELLDDTSFDLDDEEDIKRLDKFLNDEDEDLDTIEMIVDIDAETEDELKDSYVGEILLYCPVCHTIHYKNKEDVHEDEENPGIVNVGEVCPECKQEDGFEIKGMVAEYNPEGIESDETEVEDTDIDADDDISLIDIKDEDEKVEESLTKTTKALKEGLKKVSRDSSTASLEKFIDGDFSRSLKDYNADESLKEIEDTDISTNLNESLINEPNKVVVEPTKKEFSRPKALVKKLSESFKKNRKSLYEKLGVKDTKELKTLLAGKGETSIQESFNKKLEGLGFKEVKYDKPLKEAEGEKPLTKSPYKSIIGRHFNYSMDWDFLDIVADIIARIDFDDYKESEDRYEFITEEIDGYLYWTADQWCVLEAYVSAPYELDESSWSDALSELTSDIRDICDEIVGSDDVEESLKEGLQPITEIWAGEDVISDLVDRADSLYTDGNYGDLEDCVSQALDDGLIYSKDIWDLADHYGVIDDSELIDRFYEELWNDVYDEVYQTHLTDDEEEDEEDEEVEESLKESKKEEKIFTVFPDDKNELPQDFPTFEEAKAFAVKEFGKGKYTIQSPNNMDLDYRDEVEESCSKKECKEGYIKKDETGKTFCSTDGKSWEECSEEEYTELDKGGYIRLEDGETPCEDCDDFDELDEELFDKVINSYCSKMYENVDNYKTTKATAEGSKIVLEGTLTYKSGNFNRTKFIFEAKKNKKGNIKLVGLNETFAKSDKAFQLLGSIKDKKFITEGLVYNYKATINDEEKVVNGRINNK